MKNISLKMKITDFQADKISREAQKTVKGGDPQTPEEPNPLKNGGGGNG